MRDFNPFFYIVVLLTVSKVRVVMEGENAAPQWFELGIFKWFTFTLAVIQQFTTDPNASSVVRKEEKCRLANEWVYGKCKFCKYASKVQHKNPSNWARRLRVSFLISTL